MIIERAKEQDIEKIIELLGQILELHASIRPDLFRMGTTKYTEEELLEMIRDDARPIYVARDEEYTVTGYAFCVLKEVPFSNTMVPHQTLFIDDLCVDQKRRGEGIGRRLFVFLTKEAKNLGCSDVTLNVWEGNENARRFYEKLGMKPRETMMELKI
ncbi:MAG: GNAT family N-acetyltransferase [Lachnospiraceae bacterium]|nr:GNAT family N-acetyltransferase [Lachnospiraceae bacterium]